MDNDSPKEKNFRQAFKIFNIEKVARLDEKDFQRLINDEGIIRHKGKIQATINNAQRAIEIIDEKGSNSLAIYGLGSPTKKEGS